MKITMAVRLAAAGLAVMAVMSGCSNKPAVPKLRVEEAPAVREEALKLIKQGDLNQAESKLQQVTAATPGDAKAHFLLGATLYNKKQYPEAIAAYKKAIDVDPKFIEAYNNIGNTYRDMNQPQEAITWYEKAIQVDPGFAYPYTNLAGLYSSQKKYDEAIKVLQRSLAVNSTNIDTKLFLAAIYKDAGAKDKALNVVNEVLKTNPGNEAAVKLAQALKE